MNPFTVKSYWKAYKGLPKKIQRVADRKFDLWKKNPFHPSLNFKCVNTEYNIWSVRVTMDYRVLAVRNDKSAKIQYPPRTRLKILKPHFLPPKSAL